MKTNVIENANVLIKEVADSLRSANKEFTSISAVLRTIQRKDMLKAGYAVVFEKLGLVAGKVTPADFFDALHADMWGVDKKGNKFVGLWGYKKEGDKKVEVLRKVTQWTPTKFFKVFAQSQELKNK